MSIDLYQDVVDGLGNEGAVPFRFIKADRCKAEGKALWGCSRVRPQHLLFAHEHA